MGKKSERRVTITTLAAGLGAAILAISIMQLIGLDVSVLRYIVPALAAVIGFYFGRSASKAE